MSKECASKSRKCSTRRLLTGQDVLCLFLSKILATTVRDLYAGVRLRNRELTVWGKPRSLREAFQFRSPPVLLDKHHHPLHVSPERPPHRLLHQLANLERLQHLRLPSSRRKRQSRDRLLSRTCFSSALIQKGGTGGTDRGCGRNRQRGSPRWRGRSWRSCCGAWSC